MNEVSVDRKRHAKICSLDSPLSHCLELPRVCHFRATCELPISSLKFPAASPLSPLSKTTTHLTCLTVFGNIHAYVTFSGALTHIWFSDVNLLSLVWIIWPATRTQGGKGKVSPARTKAHQVTKSWFSPIRPPSNPRRLDWLHQQCPRSLEHHLFLVNQSQGVFLFVGLTTNSHSPKTFQERQNYQNRIWEATSPPPPTPPPQYHWSISHGLCFIGNVPKLRLTNTL